MCGALGAAASWRGCRLQPPFPTGSEAAMGLLEQQGPAKQLIGSVLFLGEALSCDPHQTCQCTGPLVERREMQSGTLLLKAC